MNSLMGLKDVLLIAALWLHPSFDSSVSAQGQQKIVKDPINFYTTICHLGVAGGDYARRSVGSQLCFKSDFLVVQSLAISGGNLMGCHHHWFDMFSNHQVHYHIGNSSLMRASQVELVCSEGYPIQEHKLFTDDGYFVLLHRIPRGRFRAKIPRKSSHYQKIHVNHHPDFDDCLKESANLTSTGFPILLVPGLLMASDGWLLQGPGNDLAYNLIDEGFDVWLLDVRGSFYTRKHKTLKPSDPRFWDFSFHEQGMQDLPTAIDYIIKVTNKPKIVLLGHSIGTSLFFVMAASRPEYREKLIGFVGFAPVAYMKESHMNPDRKRVFDFLGRLLTEVRRIGVVHEILPRVSEFVDFGRGYCAKGSPLQDLCYDLVVSFSGYHSKLVSRNIFQRYSTHFPTGTSVKALSHCLQNVKGNCFKPYNYGRTKNLQLYGTPVPPDYPLWNITTPVALYYTKNDFFYSAEDINDLMKVLPNVVDVDVKTKFNHIDYVWAFNAKDTLYPKVVSLIKRLRGNAEEEVDMEVRRTIDGDLKLGN